MKYFVYILQCADLTLYCGSTNNVKKRLNVHNAGKGAKYTRARLPVKLLVAFDCESKSEALKLENKIKRLSRQQKLKLIEEFAL